MNKPKYVFSQLIEFLDYDQFRHIVDKYGGNRYVKHFTCWNQLLTLMFGQLGNRESLRDLITIIEAHHQKCYHLEEIRGRFFDPFLIKGLKYPVRNKSH